MIRPGDFIKVTSHRNYAPSDLDEIGLCLQDATEFGPDFKHTWWPQYISGYHTLPSEWMSTPTTTKFNIIMGSIISASDLVVVGHKSPINIGDSVYAISNDDISAISKADLEKKIYKVVNKSNNFYYTINGNDGNGEINIQEWQIIGTKDFDSYKIKLNPTQSRGPEGLNDKLKGFLS